MDSTALYKLSYGLYVVGTKKENGFAGCIVDALIQATVKPATLLLCCNHNNFTNSCIKENKEFTVCVLTADVDPFVIANFGFQSSREVDKWNNVSYTEKDGLPVLNKAAAYLRCTLSETKELSTHSLFICEILDAWQGEGNSLIYGEYQKNMRKATMEAFQAYKNNGATPVKSTDTTVHTFFTTEEKKSDKKWICSICGYVYDGKTPFEDLSDDWKCPLCKQPKRVFIKEA